MCYLWFFFQFGLFIFLEVLLFLMILVVGFVYCWRKGDLDWMKLHAADPARKLENESSHAAEAVEESEAVTAS